jgi:hypothetical protein
MTMPTLGINPHDQRDKLVDVQLIQTQLSNESTYIEARIIKSETRLIKQFLLHVEELEIQIRQLGNGIRKEILLLYGTIIIAVLMIFLILLIFFH